MLEDQELHLIHRAGQVADMLLTKALEDLSITPRQLAILSAVGQLGECSQTDIIDFTAIDRSTVADLVRRLVERGLVTRQRLEHDNRIYGVTLTSEGEALREKGTAREVDCERELLSALSSADAIVFRASLESIVNRLGPVQSAIVAAKLKK